MKLLSDKKPFEGKLEGLSQLAAIFEIEGVNLETYVSQAEVKKLGEKMGKTINVTTIGFAIAETGASVALVINPAEKNKCLLIAASKDAAQSFYDAFEEIKQQKKGEQIA